MTETQCDAAVIGAGPGGYVAAIRLAQLGKKTVCIDRDRLGGVCLNYGCIPSKALIHAASLVDHIRRAGALGIKATLESVDLGKLQEWKNGVVRKLTGGIGILFKQRKVDFINGSARFRSPHELEVTTDQGTQVLNVGATIIATGSRPIQIPGFAFDGQTIISSKEALELTKLPEAMAVIGGGVIGLELGMVYAKLGSKVTVIELMPTILPGKDPDLIQVIGRSLKKRGMAVHTKALAKSAQEQNGRVAVAFEAEGQEQNVVVDVVLVAVGIRPNSEDMGLEGIGIQLDKKGFIQVDSRLQTNVPGVFAIGDVRGGFALAHKASKEGIIAAEAIAGLPSELDYRAMPAAIFTDPEAATVGLSEAEAKEQGYTVRVGKFPFAASGRALSTNETDGFVKIVADATTDQILGVQIVGADASNLISEAALAIEMGACAEDLAMTVHPHPTLPECLMEAAEAAHGRAIHIVQ